MELNFTAQEICYLWQVCHKNFYHEQPDRFEIMENENEPEEGGALLWCGSQYLNAKIVAKFYRGTLYAETSIMWDMSEQEWVVWMTLEADALELVPPPQAR